MTGTSNQSPLDLTCTNGRVRIEAAGGFLCQRRAVEFYRDSDTGFMFATCRKCLERGPLRAGYARITEQEYRVRQVMES